MAWEHMVSTGQTAKRRGISVRTVYGRKKLAGPGRGRRARRAAPSSPAPRPRSRPRRSQHHAPARDAADVRGDLREVDVCVLQNLQDPVALRGLLLDERRPVARQITKVADGLGRDEAPDDPSAAMRLGDPLRIPDVGLASPDAFDRARVGQRQDKVRVPQGCPGHARALQRHGATAEGLEPVAETQKTRCRRRELADVLLGSRRRSAEHAGRDELGVDVEAATGAQRHLPAAGLRPACSAVGMWRRTVFLLIPGPSAIRRGPSPACHRRKTSTRSCTTNALRPTRSPPARRALANGVDSFPACCAAPPDHGGSMA